MTSTLEIVNLLFLMWITLSNCSDVCRSLYPIEPRLCDIEGQWNMVLTTEDKPRKDCAGFFGQMTDYNKGTYRATGGLGHNPTMQAEVKDRQIQFNAIDKRCKDTYNYKVALIEDSFICFYTCGENGMSDKAQCFTKNACISEKDRLRLYNGLRFFGLKIAEDDFHIVDRSDCGPV